jgi:cytochrome P450 family 26 subfamily A
VINKHRRASPGIPPGAFAWDFIDEIFQFLGFLRKPNLREFYDSRTLKYGSLFTTSVYCEPTIVFYRPEGNRLLFANENKLVVRTWPSSVGKLFGTALVNATGDDAKRFKRMLMTFLRPEALHKFVGGVDSITRCHLAEHWIDRDEVTVFPLIKHYTLGG